MKWKKWIKAAGIRAIKTVCQTAVALIPVGVSINEVGWLAVIGTSILAGIVSLLTSVAGLPELKGDDVNVEHQKETDIS